MQKATRIPLSGLPLTLSLRGIRLGATACVPEFEIKRYRAFRKFFKADRLDNNKILYYIYRNCCLEKDSPLLNKRGVRYDLTLLSPGRIGKEPIRTVGHLHKSLPHTGRLPEIYQVLSGSAIFLFHDTVGDTMYAVPRHSGEKIVIPPQCAHITINSSETKPLLIANLFARVKNASDYGFFKKTSGPAWYPVRKGTRIIFEKNSRIRRSIPLVSGKIPKLPPGVGTRVSLYREFIKDPEKFSFLTNPKKYAKMLSVKSLFA